MMKAILIIHIAKMIDHQTKEEKQKLLLSNNGQNHQIRKETHLKLEKAIKLNQKRARNQLLVKP